MSGPPHYESRAGLGAFDMNRALWVAEIGAEELMGLESAIAVLIVVSQYCFCL